MSYPYSRPRRMRRDDFSRRLMRETTLGADDGSIRLCVVGRPNVGKSTLINRIVGEERVLAFDQPRGLERLLEDHLAPVAAVLHVALHRVRERLRLLAPVAVEAHQLVQRALQSGPFLRFVRVQRFRLLAETLELLRERLQHGRQLLLALRSEYLRLLVEQRARHFAEFRAELLARVRHELFLPLQELLGRLAQRRQLFLAQARVAQLRTQLRELAGRTSLSELAKQVVQRSGYLHMLRPDEPEDESRRENVQELLGSIEEQERETQRKIKELQNRLNSTTSEVEKKKLEDQERKAKSNSGSSRPKSTKPSGGKIDGDGGKKKDDDDSIL